MTSRRPVSDLDQMLAGMEPALHAAPYLFIVQDGEGAPLTIEVKVFAVIDEDEGRTVIIEASDDDVRPWFARITLQVHSALEGVGLTAAVSTALAKSDIACNMVAGFHHDHLFVPWDSRSKAIAVLEELMAASQN